MREIKYFKLQKNSSDYVLRLEKEYGVNKVTYSIYKYAKFNGEFYEKTGLKQIFSIEVRDRMGDEIELLGGYGSVFEVREEFKNLGIFTYFTSLILKESINKLYPNKKTIIFPEFKLTDFYEKYKTDNYKIRNNAYKKLGFNCIFDDTMQITGKVLDTPVSSLNLNIEKPLHFIDFKNCYELVLDLVHTFSFSNEIVKYQIPLNDESYITQGNHRSTLSKFLQELELVDNEQFGLDFVKYYDIDVKAYNKLIELRKKIENDFPLLHSQNFLIKTISKQTIKTVINSNETITQYQTIYFIIYNDIQYKCLSFGRLESEFNQFILSRGFMWKRFNKFLRYKKILEKNVQSLKKINRFVK